MILRLGACRPAARACAVALSLWLAACAGLPDLERGRRELQDGDFAAAEMDLRPLAEQGYLEAQIKLAGLYAELGTEQANQQAVHWYRVALPQDPALAVPLAHTLLRTGDPAVLKEAEDSLRSADRNGDPRALAALIDFYTDYPQLDRRHEAAAMVRRAEKINHPETEAVVIRWYRHNPDPRYAAELIKRCQQARERQPDCYVDLARHYRLTRSEESLRELLNATMVRAETGELPGRVLERVAWSLVSEGGGEMQPELAYRLLKRVDDGSAQSKVRMARLMVEYPYLDPAGDPEALLRDALKQGSQEAALALGRLYLTGTRVVADPAAAEKFLTQAAPSQPAAHYFLGRIYKRGILGRADPVRAAQHFLTAARGGYVSADLALAELFSDARGARVNRVNAHVFARMALINDQPRSAPLLATIKAGMSTAELKKADELWREELALRKAGPLTGPALAAGADQLRSENTQ